MTKPFTARELHDSLGMIAGKRRAIEEEDIAAAQEQMPRLNRALTAVRDRLDVELDEGKREQLHTLEAALCVLLKWGHEYTEAELAEQLAVLEGM